MEHILQLKKVYQNISIITSNLYFFQSKLFSYLEVTNRVPRYSGDLVTLDISRSIYFNPLPRMGISSKSIFYFDKVHG